MIYQCVSSSSRSDPDDIFSIDHPFLDLSLEAVEKMYEECPPVMPWSPVSHQVPSYDPPKGSSTVQSEVFDLRYLDRAYQAMEVDPLHSQKESGNVSASDKVEGNVRPIKKGDKDEARNDFYLAAERLGSGLKEETLRRRFRAYITDDLIQDLISCDKERRYRATASILLHRSTSMKRSKIPSSPDRMSRGMPLYNGLTQEDILKQVYSIMDVTPAEDLRGWWYNRINKYAHKSDFADLFCHDRKKQEAVVTKMSGLMRQGRLWLRKVHHLTHSSSHKTS